MNARQAEAVAMARMVNYQAIKTIKRLYAPDHRLNGQAYLDSADAADQERAKALCQAAGVAVNADPRAILDEARASGQVNSLVLSVAYTMLES